MLRRNLRFFHASPVSFMPYEPLRTNPIVFLDISSFQKHNGRVTIELFADVVPKTAENFRSLCTGERGDVRYVPSNTGTCKLYYKGVPFHRIIPGFCLQGGDILHMDGRGNESIFGFPFYDESFEGKAGKHLPGTLGMASSSPNQNGSQFFFNLSRAEHLDGKYVVFGQVLDGWDVLQHVARDCGSRSGTPIASAWISECGQAGVEEERELVTGAAPHLLPGKEVLELLKPREASNRHPWK